MSALYFSYGAWMYSRNLKATLSDWSLAPRLARLPGHRPIVDRLGGMSVEPAAGDEVWGIAWRITAEQLTRLDELEAVSFDRYRRHLLAINVGGQSLEAIGYISPHPAGGICSTHYFSAVMTGAIEHGLPQPYIERLEALGPRWTWLDPHNPACERPE